jgi:hypothetical protein
MVKHDLNAIDQTFVCGEVPKVNYREMDAGKGQFTALIGMKGCVLDIDALQCNCRSCTDTVDNISTLLQKTGR